jgi:hypothetical protein
MTVFKSVESAIDFVKTTTLDGPSLALAITEPLTFCGAQEHMGLGMAILLDAILARRYEPDGVEQHQGFRLYRYRRADQLVHLTVTDENGQVVAEVDTGSDFDPAPDGPCFVPVIGHFERGPAFPRVQAMLDRFTEVYQTGNLERAHAVHEELDRLGLRAKNSDGRVYQVCVIYFQQDALLFTATAP